MGWKKWSAQEIAVLKRVADSGETLTENMHLLPNRTWDAARSQSCKLGLSLSKSVAWSDEERSILRGIWLGNQSIKVGLKKLPHRSYGAAKGEAQRLGLTGRTKKLGRTGYSYVETVITEVLTDGIPMTIKELVDHTGFSRHAIDSILRRRHGKAFHIEAYSRSSRYGNFASKWTIGGGRDAKRPARKSATQACREWRHREALKQNGFNPFLTVAAQVMA